jgi:copper chaperone NosL
MKQEPISITSRLLVAFASGALVAVFFLPAWRIDLFAPQYPEGLTLKIWINNLTGDVDIINGLNHYIGMKPFSKATFPEFNFLPWVVGFYMMLGILIAITGSRKLLLAYILLCVAGGALALYDFYQWGYNYGHQLDPKAPIQVPGLTYQPPVIGHKRLLNFDAYSSPDIGGWVVIIAAGLIGIVWFFEWYRVKKKRKTAKIPAMLFAGSLFFAACKRGPEPFDFGKDNCYTCKMQIVDARFGGECITQKGKIYKFDDVICMIRFLKSGIVDASRIKKNYIINFEKENSFIDVKDAVFVSAPDLNSPMGSNTAAFDSPAAARKFSDGKQGQQFSWDFIYNKIQ